MAFTGSIRRQRGAFIALFFDRHVAFLVAFISVTSSERRKKNIFRFFFFFRESENEISGL
jgi:hypothetical protein